MKDWSYEDEWFEETNISRKIKKYLEINGYEIIKFNEDKRQKGHDIEARKDGKTIIIEVKGYPSDKYVRGEKKGQKKPTNPNLQAKHWFAEALLSLLIEKSRNPKYKIAIGLPKYKIYEGLVASLKYVFKKLQIDTLIVGQNEVLAKGL